MHRSILFLALLGTILLAAGCDDQPRERPAAAKPAAPADAPVGDPLHLLWRDPEGQGVIEVDGRRIEVMRAVCESHMDYKLIKIDYFYAVVDAESRLPLIPQQEKTPTIIPGRGLFMPPDEGKSVYTRLNMHSGELMPTDLVAIMDYNAPEPSEPATAAKRTEYMHVIISNSPANGPHYQVAEILSPEGVVLATYKDYANLTELGGYHILRVEHADRSGEQHLLGHLFEHIATVSAVQEIYIRKPPREGFDGDSREFTTDIRSIVCIQACCKGPMASTLRRGSSACARSIATAGPLLNARLPCREKMAVTQIAGSSDSPWTARWTPTGNQAKVRSPGAWPMEI